MPTPRAAIFDMDGLMFNTEDVYTVVGTEVLRRRGCTFTEDLKNALMGLTAQAAFQTMIDWHGLEDSWEALRRESNELFIRVLADELAPMPGLFPLLDALEAAGIPRAIATSSDRELLDACLAPFDLRRRFEFALTSEDVTRGKPHPEVYLQAAARFGVSPSETAVFEDSQNGCRAAHAAGAFTIAVPGQHSRTHDFSNASLVVASLADPSLYAALNLRTPA